MDAVVRLFDRDQLTGFDSMGPGRRQEVVEERTPANEALDPEELLGVQPAIRGPMLGMALVRDAAFRDVEHARLLLAPA